MATIFETKLTVTRSV